MKCSMSSPFLRLTRKNIPSTSKRSKDLCAKYAQHASSSCLKLSSIWKAMKHIKMSNWFMIIKTKKYWIVSFAWNISDRREKWTNTSNRNIWKPESRKSNSNVLYATEFTNLINHWKVTWENTTNLKTPKSDHQWRRRDRDHETAKPICEPSQHLKKLTTKYSKRKINRSLWSFRKKNLS